MKIKFTWGTGIFITIIIFVSFFTSFIIFSLTQDVNLVSKDYFPEEIAYESKLQKIKNANELKDKIKIEQEENQLTIFYPETFENKDLSGIIKFYFVTSYRYDKEFKVNMINNKQIINFHKYKKGRYYLQIDWIVDETEYFQEFKITL